MLIPSIGLYNHGKLIPSTSLNNTPDDQMTVLVESSDTALELTFTCTSNHSSGLSFQIYRIYWIFERCWINFQCRDVILNWIIVGQGPFALAVGAGGVRSDIFSPVYLFSFLSLFFLPLWETT